MSTVERRARRTTENDVQGEIQDPHVSTTVDRPCQTKSRIRFLETEYTRLPYRPLPSTYFHNFTSLLVPSSLHLVSVLLTLSKPYLTIVFLN